MLINRFAKKTLQSVVQRADWAAEQANVVLGEPGDETSNPGRIRRFYTASYKDLDNFDKEWYACFYDKRDQNWEINYVWSVILATIVNGRSAFNEDHQSREPMKAFARTVLTEIQDYVENM